MTQSSPYVGRFAPSPTGLLHLGSLTCALASYLDARQHGGSWLVRLENLDPPREQPGAGDAIIRSLALHGLASDRPILWQSQRHTAYRDCLTWLEQQTLVYPCNCSRQRLAGLAGRYDGFCRQHPALAPFALRLKVSDLPSPYEPINRTIAFVDRHLGPQEDDLTVAGDFIVLRKDGLFAYQLAVVVDDIAQGITHVVRGSDILDATARQIYLFHLLRQPAPNYCHIPVVSNRQGQKLSKQNRAEPLNPNAASLNIWRALSALGAAPPASLRKAPPPLIIDWAINHWSVAQLPQGTSVGEDTLG